MQKKNEWARLPSRLSVSFLALAITAAGCGGSGPLSGEAAVPEQKTEQAASLSVQALNRTLSPVPRITPPSESKPLSPRESASAAESEPSLDLEPPQPSRAEALSAIGESAYRQEDYTFAEKNFREALAYEPELLHALTGLGWTLYDSNRPDEAFFIFHRANERYPESGSARRGLAYLFYRYGRMKEAKALLGSLDKTRWPELANIEHVLKARAIKGLSAPRLPMEDSKQEEPAESPAKSAPLEHEPEEPSTGPQKTPKTEPRPEIVKLSPPEPAPEEMKPPTSHEAPPGPLPPVRKPSLEGMVNIPGGRFTMGVEFTGQGRRNRRSRRRRVTLKTKGGRPVEVASFRLDKFEITNALYEDFVRATGEAEPPFWRKVHFTGPHLPVVGVTWDEARAYCAWAGKRLPTEAEWEYAARGAGKRRRYPWGNAQRDRNAVFGLSPDAGGPKAVGRRPEGASVHGVEDLAGNVWEWVEDEFRTKPEDARPISRNGRPLRTLKGGSWVNGWWALASSHRTGDLPDRRLPAYGFRCAADAPE